MKKSLPYKSKLYKILFLALLALVLSNCQTEEENITDNGKKIETVNPKEALSFLKQNIINTDSKTGKNSVLPIDLNSIYQEKIINSDQLITVVPISSGH